MDDGWKDEWKKVNRLSYCNETILQNYSICPPSPSKYVSLDLKRTFILFIYFYQSHLSSSLSVCPLWASSPPSGSRRRGSDGGTGGVDARSPTAFCRSPYRGWAVDRSWQASASSERSQTEPAQSEQRSVGGNIIRRKTSWIKSNLTRTQTEFEPVNRTSDLVMPTSESVSGQIPHEPLDKVK